jgi:hypothetical protein
MTFNSKNDVKTLLINDDVNKLNNLINDIEDTFRQFAKHYTTVEEFVRIIPALTERRYIKTKDEM